MPPTPVFDLKSLSPVHNLLRLTLPKLPVKVLSCSCPKSGWPGQVAARYCAAKWSFAVTAEQAHLQWRTSAAEIIDQVYIPPLIPFASAIPLVPPHIVPPPLALAKHPQPTCAYPA